MMISTMTISDLASVSLVVAQEEVRLGMTTLTTIGTMMMIGEVQRQRRLEVTKGGMTIGMMIGMMMMMIGMMMIGKPCHKASRTVVEVAGADRWLIGGPICGIKPHLTCAWTDIINSLFLCCAGAARIIA